MINNKKFNIRKSGKYGLSIRYSNNTGQVQQITLLINHEEKKLTLPPTVNKFTFAEKVVSSVLPVGETSVEIIRTTYFTDSKNTEAKLCSANDMCINIASINLFKIYEACDAAFFGSMSFKDYHDDSPAFQNDGDGLKFKINVSKSGQYALRIHYGAGNTNSEPQSITININNTKKQLLLASLRNLSVRSDFVMNVHLKAGVNTISFIKNPNDIGQLIIDYIGIVSSDRTYIGKISETKGIGTSEVIFSCENADVLVSSISGSVVKVFADPDRTFNRTYDSFTVLNEDLGKENFEIKELKDRYILSLSKIDLWVFKNPFRITYIDKNKKVLAKNTKKSMSWTPSGECFVNNRHFKGEHFYGLGEKVTSFDHTGEKLQMWAVDAYGNENDSSVPSWENGRWYMSNPYYLSSRGYSILFDNSSFTEFDLACTKKSICTFGSSNPNPGGKLVYYFIYGPSFKALSKSYTDMAGKSFFAPKWAYGNMQCHYGYTQADIERVATKYRELDLPIDVILSDIEWYEYLCAPTLFNKTNYPSPEKMFKTLKALNIRYGLINDPNITDRDNNEFYKEGEEKGYYVTDISGKTKQITWPWGGPSGLVDFFNPEARKWWGTLIDGIIKQGVSCMWLDMNEPSKYNPDWFFWNEEGKSYGSFNEVKNAYAIKHQQAVYEKMTENGKRSFLQTRSGYSGTHRYASPWTGDIQGSYQSMHEQIMLGLGLSLSGYNYWGFDIGGFFTTIDERMYKRWVELATFTPVHRFHYCAGVEEKEPWTHNALDTSRKFLNMRYKFVPYMYSLAADNIIGIGIENDKKAGGSNLPLVRPMVMEFGDDPHTLSIDTQFMCGPSLLVAPVLDDTDYKKVYLPKCDWYDYNNPQQHFDGGKEINYHAGEDVLPLFIKAGSVIPKQSKRSYMADPNASKDVIYDIYPTFTDGDFSFVLYEDDGITQNFKNGEYTTTAVHCNIVKSSLIDLMNISLGERNGAFKDIPERYTVLNIHCDRYQCVNVTANGATLPCIEKDSLTSSSDVNTVGSKDEYVLYSSKEQLCIIKLKDTGKLTDLIFTGKHLL